MNHISSILLLVLALLASKSSSAQSSRIKTTQQKQSVLKQASQQNRKNSDEVPFNRITIGVDLSLLAFKNCFNTTIEWKLNRNSGIGVEFGYSKGAPGLLNIGSGKLDRQAILFGVYGRKYLHKDLQKSIYFGAGASFLRETFFRTNDWYRLGNQYYHYEAAAVKKQAFGLYLQIGKRARFFKKLYLDTFADVGVRATLIRHGAVDVQPVDNPILGGIMSRMDRREGWQMAPTLRFGVRINLVSLRK
jgi:hypothetical protein